MASVPPGLLSFLYHVMNDTEMNDKFREDPYEIMEFFKLTDDQRKTIYKAGEGLVQLRRQREKLRKEEIKQRKQKENKQTSTEEEYEYGYEYIYIKAEELEKFYVADKDVKNLVKDDNGKPKEPYRDVKDILAAVENELLEGVGRFW